jgi:ankyrin repeat protein
MLLEGGADKNETAVPGWTPLFLAAKYGNKGCMKLLIEAGADMESAEDDECEETPLLIAVKYGHQECIEILLDAGADVNAADYYGITPLCIAAEDNNAEIVIMLLDAGANIYQYNVFGKNALCLAAKQSDDYYDNECFYIMLNSIARNVLIMAHRKNMIVDTAFIVFKKCVQDNYTQKTNAELYENFIENMNYYNKNYLKI